MEHIKEIPVLDYDAFEVTAKVEFLEDVGQEWASFDLVEAGATLAEQSGEERFRHTKITKRILANLLPWMRGMVFVHIPRFDTAGKPLSSQTRREMLIAVTEWRPGVLIYSQSGGKEGTFALIPKTAFEKLAVGWNRKTDGEKFAATVGLLLSSLSGKALTIRDPIVYPDGPGHDGNCLGSRAYLGRHSVQTRLLGLRCTPKGEIRVCLEGKGQIRPIKGLVDAVQVEESLVKHNDGKTDILVVALNEDVNSRSRRQYVTFEVIQCLQDLPGVRRWLQEWVRREVTSILGCLGPDHRLALLDRLGGLRVENGELLEAQQAVISALRSSVPYCQEIEQRVGRFALRLIAEKIIPSSGIWGWTYMVYQDDKRGESACEWEEATCFGFRMPVPGPDALVPFKRNPRGLVTSEVAARMNGDSDTDMMVVVDRYEVVELFKRYRLDFVSGRKPDKVRNKSPLTPERMLELSIQMMDDSWLMGAMTLAEAKFVQLGMYEEAGMAGFLANVAPMLIKWDIALGSKPGVPGVPVRKVIAQFLRQHRALLKATPLQWRERMLASRGVRSPRDLAGAAFHIESELSMLDSIWNAAHEAIVAWAAATKPPRFSFVKAAKVLFAGTQRFLPGAASRWKYETVSRWGRYWEKFREENPDEEGFDPRKHKGIIEEMVTRGQAATREGLAALCLWVPQDPLRDGFFLKWLCMGHRWEEVFGLNHEVKAWLFDQKGLDKWADGIVSALLPIED